jgi:hypothetical protein
MPATCYCPPIDLPNPPLLRSSTPSCNAARPQRRASTPWQTCLSTMPPSAGAQIPRARACSACGDMQRSRLQTRSSTPHTQPPRQSFLHPCNRPQAPRALHPRQQIAAPAPQRVRVVNGGAGAGDHQGCCRHRRGRPREERQAADRLRARQQQGPHRAGHRRRRAGGCPSSWAAAGSRAQV